MLISLRRPIVASRLPGLFTDAKDAIYLSYEQTPRKLRDPDYYSLDEDLDNDGLNQLLRDVHETCGPAYLTTTEWLQRNYTEEFGIQWDLSEARSLFNAWFHSYITSAYDLFFRIQILNNRDQEYFAPLLEQRCFRVPTTAPDVKGLCSSEIGRHQLFTILAPRISRLEPEFRENIKERTSIPAYTVQRPADLVVKHRKFSERLFEKNWAQFREAIKRRIARLVSDISHPVAYFLDIHLPGRLENNLLIRSHGKIRTLSPNFELIGNDLPPDFSLRKRLCRPRGNDPFLVDLMRGFEFFMPKTCAEGFLENNRRAEATCPKNGKLHLSYAHQSDEKYAFFSNAMRRVNGHKLYSTMHAGPYFLANLWQLPISLCAEGVIGFGGEERLFQNSLKIGGAYKTDFERTLVFDSEDLVYFSTVMPQNSIDGSFSSVQMNRYFLAQKKFFSALSKGTRDQIIYRPFKQDYERDFFEKVAPYLKGIRIDDLNLSGVERMQRSKLVICDNINTVYYEVIKLGVPTILIVDRDIFIELDTYKPLYEELRAAKILWHDLSAAVDFLESIRNNPKTWWNSPPTKAARALFLEYLDPFESHQFEKNMIRFIDSATG